MTAVPYCNVPIAEPPGDPTSPTGFQLIPNSASLSQIISMINNNFSLLQKGNFAEDRSRRVSQIVTLRDPNNPNVSVDVEIINQTYFRNPATGQSIVWKR